MPSFDPATFSSLDDARSGRWYLPGSPELQARHDEVARLLREFNALANTDIPAGEDILRKILEPDSAIPEVFAPLYCEYGNISVGEGCFFNFQTVLLDVAPITFGARVLVAPNCQFITVSHPINDVAMRAGGWEQARPITVGNDCWFGAGVMVMPGVTIGDRCVLAAGALITRDIPDDSLVMGSPGRVVRQLGQPGDALERDQLPNGVPYQGKDWPA